MLYIGEHAMKMVKNTSLRLLLRTKSLTLARQSFKLLKLPVPEDLTRSFEELEDQLALMGEYLLQTPFFGGDRE